MTTPTTELRRQLLMSRQSQDRLIAANKALTAELERVKQKTSMMLEQYELEEKEVNHWKAKCDALTAELAKKDENIRMLEIVEKEMAKDIDALTAELAKKDAEIQKKKE